LFINCRPKQAAHAGKKRQIHEVTTLRSIPLGAASARLRSAHCLASLGISSPLYTAYHHLPSRRTGQAQPFIPPALLYVPNIENRHACENATPQLGLSALPNTRQCCIHSRSLIVVCHCLYHNAVNPRVTVTSHQPRPSHSSTTAQDKTTTTIPQRLTVVINSRDSLPSCFPSPTIRPPTLPFCTTCSYPLASRTQGGVPRMHACLPTSAPVARQRDPSREWQASQPAVLSAYQPTFPLLLWPPVILHPFCTKTSRR
jgi:hypothetical protein